MDARRFLLDLMWDPTDPSSLRAGGTVAALYLEPMRITDDIEFSIPLRYHGYVCSQNYVISTGHKRPRRLKGFSHVLVVKSDTSFAQKLVDMRDMVPSSEYTMPAPRSITPTARVATTTHDTGDHVPPIVWAEIHAPQDAAFERAMREYTWPTRNGDSVQIRDVPFVLPNPLRIAPERVYEPIRPSQDHAMDTMGATAALRRATALYSLRGQAEASPAVEAYRTAANVIDTTSDARQHQTWIDEEY